MRPVKQKIGWLWQNGEKILIVLFFATFTLNIRKVFLTRYSFLNGGFNEYLTPNIIWADVLMILVIFIYTIKWIYYQVNTPHSNNTLQNIVIRFLSSVINPYYGKNVSRLPHTIIYNICQIISRAVFLVRGETFWLFIFLGWAGLSVFWSQFWPIAAYRFLVLVEVLLFAYVCAKAINSSRWLKLSLLALIINGTIQSLLGIVQFAKNSSLGLRVLGESIVGPNIAGVAKVIIEGEKYIRAYGTFPHPNILAGFLVFSLMLFLAEGVNRSNNVSRETLLGFIPTWFVFISGVVVAAGLLFSFSRSAFLGLFVGSFVFFVHFFLKHGKFNHRLVAIAGLLIMILFASGIWLSRCSTFFSNQSLTERNLYQIVSYETISKYPIGGVGLGNFAYYGFITHPNFESWQYQPVHNIFLLIFSELGFVGLVALLLMLLAQLRKFQIESERGEKHYLTKKIIYCILLSFFAISFFDHYFWDIKIGMLIFALPFILFHAVRQTQQSTSEN